MSDSLYWRGTVTYLQGGTRTVVSNTGSSIAPERAHSTSSDDNVWLPPSPVPAPTPWPNLTQPVDPNDPIGLNYIFVQNDDCDLSGRYLRKIFTEQPIAAVLDTCDFEYCPAFLSWVHPVKHLLGTSTITGKKATHALDTVHTGDGIPTGHATKESRTSDATPRIGINIQNTAGSPTLTPAPGSPIPKTTPKATRQTENTHKPAPTPNPPHSHHESVVNTRTGPLHTKTKHGPGQNGGDDHSTGRTGNTTPNDTRKPHDSFENTRTHHPHDRKPESRLGGNESVTKTKKHRPHDTLKPTTGGESEPVIRIGTKTLSQNSDSKYLLSGKTLTPGLTTTLGSGPSATTVAVSTRGKATYVIINDETSKLGGGAQSTEVSEFLVGTKTLPLGTSVVVSQDTYSLASDGSTIFVNGYPERITLTGGKTVATLSNGMLITETEVPGVLSGSIAGPTYRGGPDRATTVLTTMSELLLGSKTLIPGTQVVISGTTYSLGPGGSQVYINGKPTRISLSDGTSVLTLPNGMIATETEATTNVSTSIGGTSGISTSLAPAPNMGSHVRLSFSVVVIGVVSSLVLSL